jgi:hypothetical protein
MGAFRAGPVFKPRRGLDNLTILLVFKASHNSQGLIYFVFVPFYINPHSFYNILSLLRLSEDNK